ncbi:hypothetical protein GCM10023232_25090 [Sphingosinicella ginsenosidimutans]|uniref:Uncharacterized protein n=1 Tax=Allosphingosinicella ginsenosidimutans TaxID=1176539 RepID=A0A5C6TUB0_9SPHN|nr:hypothetical protein [Sphingosinicella ginsenosidimutans]TXC63856.1 hypothetical protein FRZ32_09425 [Sphingosinicella ginsenosidimutans]
MKLASCIAAILFAAASPAIATGTILCRSTINPTDGPALALSIGDDGIFQARLVQGGPAFITGVGAGAPTIAQSWIDANRLSLDIVAAGSGARLARLDARRRAGDDYVGLLDYAGRSWRVRCQEVG